MTDIGDVSWWLFTKKQMTSEGLPPTKASLYPAIMRANLQAIQWQQDICQHPVIPSPSNMGWKDVEGHFESVSCIVSCAPSNILFWIYVVVHVTEAGVLCHVVVNQTS